MKHHRPERVSDLIIEELNNLLLRELDLPGGVLVTITDAEVSKDLERAAVKVSFYPSDQAPKIFKILEKKQAEFQFRLSRKLNIRPMPKISFKLDLGPEKAAGVEKKLLEQTE